MFRKIQGWTLTKHRIYKITVWAIIILLLMLAYPIGVLVLNIACDYKPPQAVIIDESNTYDTLNPGKSIEILSWNIGYCGLSCDMDFFYDGGTKVRPEKEVFFENFIEIQDFLQADTSSHLILLQEVDNGSKRSYGTKQFDNFWSLKHLDGYKAYYAPNYRVKFVPMPITTPMGKVESGLVTLSKFNPKSVVRRAYPSNERFPMRYFNLDRCAMVLRYQLSNGKELMLVNTHNSAFDDGSQRKIEMEFLKMYIEREYAAGNFIVVGGDWNQMPPGFEPQFRHDRFEAGYSLPVPADFTPKGWKWAFDNRTPTNRMVDKAYTKGNTGTTVIDCFLVSPNITVDTVYCINLGFVHSDHNPVMLKFRMAE